MVPQVLPAGTCPNVITIEERIVIKVNTIYFMDCVFRCYESRALI
jgi:hypothetical protein